MSGSSSLKVLAIVIAGLGFFSPFAAEAQQPERRLLMFDADGCEFCERWQREVGIIYAKTREGALAPLQVAKLGDALPIGVHLGAAVRYTPTFVVLNADGKEIGRITGYIGEEQFWSLLEALLPAPDRS